MLINTLSKSLKKFLIIYLKVSLALFFCLILITILSLLGVPKQLRIFVVKTGSMDPIIPTGSLIVDLALDDYSIGDVITFNTNNLSESGQTSIVTHRIVEKRTNKDNVVEFRTKGDANNTVDSFTSQHPNIIGKVLFHIPALGYVIGWGKTQVGFVIMILVPSIILIYSELLNIRKEIRRLIKKRNIKESIDLNVI